MLKEFFDSAARVDTLRMGPAGPLVQSFGQALFQAWVRRDHSSPTPSSRGTLRLLGGSTWHSGSRP